MKTLTLAALAAVVLSTTAFAQEEVASTEATAPTAASEQAARKDEPRLRFAASPYAQVAFAGQLSGGILGGQLQLGVQINDEWATYLQVQATTLVLRNVGGASVMVERQFLGHLSVAAGVGVAQESNSYWTLFEGNSQPDFTATSALVPVRVALNLGSLDPTQSTRHRFTIGLDGAMGVIVNSTSALPGNAPGGIAVSAGLSLGYTLM